VQVQAIATTHPSANEKESVMNATSAALPVIRKPHVSLNVKNVDASVAFYQQLFNAAPVKHYRDNTTVHSILLDDKGASSEVARTGYAKFDLEQPILNFVLNEVKFEANQGALSHLGLQVDSTDDVLALRQRIEKMGLKPRDEMNVSCCYARQDKFWLADPDGNEWEIFTVVEHLSPEQLRELDKREQCTTSACTNDIAAQTSTANQSSCCTGKACA
jgi:catechol 2,3-dioxygenase-like lactoylglutathione lyase family enzyme